MFNQSDKTVFWRSVRLKCVIIQSVIDLINIAQPRPRPLTFDMEANQGLHKHPTEKARNNISQVSGNFICTSSAGGLRVQTISFVFPKYTCRFKKFFNSISRSVVT